MAKNTDELRNAGSIIGAAAGQLLGLTVLCATKYLNETMRAAVGEMPDALPCHKLLFNYKEAAEALGMSTKTLAAEREAGRIKTIPTPAGDRIEHDELKRWVRFHRRK